MASRHPFAGQWNHNSHYYPLLRSLVPLDAVIVVDIGCGDGTLARYLQGVPEPAGRTVLGVDTDLAVLQNVAGGPDRSGDVAQAEAPQLRHELPGVGRALLVAASALSLPVADGSVDAVVMAMMLHHVEPVAALAEARRVLRPGGALLVFGFGARDGLRGLPAELLDTLAHRWHRRGKRHWEPPTVKSEPSLTWAQTRSLLSGELPGSTYQRLPMWRYLISWTSQPPLDDVLT